MRHITEFMNRRQVIGRGIVQGLSFCALAFGIIILIRALV